MSINFTRYYRKSNKKQRDITICAVVNENVMQLSGARCAATQQFEKALGRKIALGRAEKTPMVTVELPEGGSKEQIRLFIQQADALKANFDEIYSKVYSQTAQ